MSKQNADRAPLPPPGRPKGRRGSATPETPGRGERAASPLVDRYGAERRWVNYKLVPREGKTTKVPVGPTGRNASSTEPEDWSTYPEARARSGQVGIVFTPAKTLLGIDLDACYGAKGIVGPDREAIAELILEADTYCEVSPSGTGLHLYLALTEPLALQANRSGKFECYTEGRYFTATGVPYGEPREIREVAPEEAERLLAILGYPWARAEAAAPVAPPPQGGALDDAQVLASMFAAKGGAEARAVYGGDLSKFKGDESAADLSLCARLAFWCAGDAAQVERIWLASPLGQRKKTQTRADYRARTIAAAIAGCKEFYRPPAARARAEAAEAGFEFLCAPNAKGVPIPVTCTENAIRALAGMPEFAGRLRFDAFKGSTEVREPSGAWRLVEDNDAVVAQSALAVRYPDVFGRFGKQQVYDAMAAVARANTVDTAADWLRGLAWDGEARLGVWLAKAYGCPQDDYHRAVGENWMKGLAMRLTRPGCKFDHVLVLEGPQGSRKSTSLAVLGGAWHVESVAGTESKDFFMQFRGKAIVEFSEGELLSRTEVKRMKAIITMQSDTYRPPYERSAQDFPRRCVFAMTTNQDEYLKDETGNRRWLPVRLGQPKADVEWLAANRDQLYAEAYHRVAVLGEPAYEFPEEATRLAQAARVVHDPNAELIADWFTAELKPQDRINGVTVHQVYRDALHGGFTGKPMTKGDEMAITGVLKEHLHLVARREMRNGIRVVRYYQAGVAPELAEADAEAEAAVSGGKW